MGAPTKLTQETIDSICEALMIGATYKIACEFAGVSYQSHRNWFAAGEQLRIDLDKNEADRERIKELRRKGLSDEPIPPPMKLTAREERYLDYFDALKEANAAAAITHLNFLYQSAPQSPQISQWILTRRFDGFEEPSRRVEHSTQPGAPLEISDASGMSPEERAAAVIAIFQQALGDQGEGEDAADASPSP